MWLNERIFRNNLKYPLIVSNVCPHVQKTRKLILAELCGERLEVVDG